MKWFRSGKGRRIAAFTLMAFFVTNLAPANTAHAFSQEIIPVAAAPIPPVGLSPEIGKVEISLFGEGRLAPAVVFHIQDAHGSAEAQENIFRILSSFHAKKQLGTVFLEGASGPLSAKSLAPFKDASKNEEFINRLFRRNLINGAAKFLGKNTDVPAFGAEDPLLYRKNIETYRAFFKAKPAVRRFLNSVEVVLIEDAKKIVDPKTMHFLKSWRLQQETGGSFEKYLDLLFDYSAQALTSDWEDYALQEDWPQMTRIYRILKTRSKTDPAKLQKEFNSLKRVLGSGAKRESAWLQSILEADSVFAKDIHQPIGVPRRMAERLIREMQERGLFWSRYPELTRFLSFQILRSEIVPEILFEEVRALEQKIYDALGHHSKAGKWLEFFQDFYLLKRAFSLELRREEAARFRRLFGGNWLGSFKHFLRKDILADEKEVRPLVKKALAFYEQAESREDAFLNALSQRTKGLTPSSGSGYTVIVAGGYHKEGLERKINGRQISCGVITPRMTSGENSLPYQGLLMGDYAEISTLGPAQIALMGRPEARTMAGDAALQNFEAAFARIEGEISGQAGKVRLEAPEKPAQAVPAQFRPAFQQRSELRGRTLTVLRSTLQVMVVAGLLSGCAAPARDLVKQQIRSDREFVLPERPAILPGSVTVDKDSLALSLLKNDPVLREGGLQVMVRRAEKDRLEGSFSIRPRLGVADGKLVFSLGIGGELPGIGSIELSGLGVGNIASAVMSLAGELGKFWKGEDLLVKAMVEQAIEVADLDLQITLGGRYLHFLDLAYEIKTLEEQSGINAEILKKIDAALAVSVRNQQATEGQRQSIKDLKSEWLLRLNNRESSLKKARRELAALYAPGTLGETQLSIDLKRSRLPAGWKATIAQEQSLRAKATGKNGSGSPANRVFAQGYAARLLANTAARLEEKKASPTLEVGGFSFLDSYGSNPSADFKTEINPLTNQRTKDQAGFGISGGMTFGGKVRANKQAAHLKVGLAEAALERVRQQIEKRISELLQAMERHQNTIKLIEDRNAQIRAFLEKARAESAVTEDRLVQLVVEEEGNRIKLLSSLQEIARGIEELRVLTWDRQGLPKVFASRSELREGTGARIFARVRAKVLRPIFFGFMFFFFMSLPFVNPSWAQGRAFSSVQAGALGTKSVTEIMQIDQKRQDLQEQIARRQEEKQKMNDKISGNTRPESKSTAASERRMETPAETNALLALDQELGQAIPGFHNLVEKQAKAREPGAKGALKQQVDSYRALILKAALEGQEMSMPRPHRPANGEISDEINAETFYEPIFFSYSNPFHSAWDYPDALERSIQKKQVSVDPGFKAQVRTLAEEANLIRKKPVALEKAQAPAGAKDAREIVTERPQDAGAALAQKNLLSGQKGVSSENSVVGILLGSFGEDQKEQAFVPPVISGQSMSTEKARTTVPLIVLEQKQKPKPLPAGKTSKKVLTSKNSADIRKNVMAALKTPSKKAVAIPAAPRTQESQDRGKAFPSQSSAPHGTILHKEKGQVVVTLPKPVTLKVPFPADKMSFSVKAGDVVEKGALLARGIDSGRENRMQFLKNRSEELHRLIMNGRENPGTLDRDTLFRYQFELAEVSLELDRLTVERDGDILLAPRSAMIQTLPQGPATDGGMAVQIVPLNEGILTLPLSIKNFGFDNVELSVDGKRVTVTDWEAGGFDLAKGTDGEFNLAIHFISSKAATSERGKLCEYDIALIRSGPLDKGQRNIHKPAGFHTIVPPSQWVRVGIPSVPGIPAGVFYATVQDGQAVNAGDILGAIRIPAAHEKQIRRADELVRLAEKNRSSNTQFRTLPESAVQEFETKAQRAKASVKRNSPAVTARAPVGGRIQGVTALDGQILATGRITEARVLSEEIFFGTSTDPRSEEWSGRLSNDDPHLIPVEKGSLKKGDKVSISTAGGVLSGEVYAMIPLANRGVRLYSGLDGIVIKAVDKKGILGVGSAVNIEFDGGKFASERNREQSVFTKRQAPPLRVQNDIPPAIQQEFQRHPGQKIGILRVLELTRSEKNIQQKFEMLEYFLKPLGFRYVNKFAAAMIIGLLGLWFLPTLFFVAARHRKQEKFFSQDAEKSLAKLKGELQEIEMRLTRKVNRRKADPVHDPDAQVVREIIAPMQDWVKLIWEHEDLGAEERDTITTKASELAQNHLLRFSRGHFEDLAEIWKSDTRYLAKIRGLLASLSILTGKTVDRQLRAQYENEDEIEISELLRFKEKMADFSENFNEGYNLAHRLIALSQVIDLYPPKLNRGAHKLEFSEWREIVRNRKVIWTFPAFRFLLAVSAMVKINQWVTLRSFKNVAVNMQKLGISGFLSVPEAMSAAKEGLYQAFHPVANVDELEGNKLAAYYGRWLGRLMVIVGVLVVIQFPAFLALLGLSHFIASGAILFLQFTAPAIAIWRHVGPMLKKLNGEKYSVMKSEIQALRRSAEKKEWKPAGIRKPKASRISVHAPSRSANARDEDTMMEKMRRALLDEDLKQRVETVVLLPPKHGGNKKFFEEMAAQDEVLKRVDFTIAESDGLFPGNAGQFFAARDLAQTPDKKIKIYWFPQTGVPFSVAMALFKFNFAEALRMAGDFKKHEMKSGEIIFPGGDLSSNAINYTRNGGNIIIDARPASLEEVKKDRHPVMLGRNGSPLYDVEHVVRRPEDLQGILSQYGHRLGAGLSLGNSITPQFPVSKGPLALVSNNDEESERMEELLAEFRKKIENLTERYGPFPVDLVEDFSGVAAEFRRQLLENNSVPPNLQHLARIQKTFPNVQDIANPYGKIYGVLGKTLWSFYRNRQQGPPRVEVFVPAPSDYLFVSGNNLEGVRARIKYMQRRFPELVNAVAAEGINSDSAPDVDSQKFVFSDSKNGSEVYLTKEAGNRRNLAIRKAAAFVTKDGKMIFQRRSRQISINPGLLDLPVFEQMEPGETSEAAVRRGFLEELRDGQPLPLLLSALPMREVKRVSYEVPHEKKRTIPSKRKEDVSIFHFSLSEEFGWNEFIPGEDAVEIVAYPFAEVFKMRLERHGVFTPRTYTILEEFLSEIKEAAVFTGHEGAGRSELREGLAREAVLPEYKLREAVEPPPLKEKPLQEAREASVSESTRLLTAIKITERLLGPHDEKLLPRLKALLEDPAFLLERTEPEMRGLLALPAEIFRSMQQRTNETNAANTLFLDARIGIRDEHLLLLSRLPFRVFILFDRGQSSRRAAVEKKMKGMTLPAGQFQLMEAPDGVSALILKWIRPLITHAQYQRSDYAFIGTNRREVQKVKNYVGNLVYYDTELKEYDEGVLFSFLWYLVTSPQLFGLGQKRDICWGMKDALMLVAEQLVVSLRSEQAIKTAV
jgi:hypothetical protein